MLSSLSIKRQGSGEQRCGVHSPSGAPLSRQAAAPPLAAAPRRRWRVFSAHRLQPVFIAGQ